MTGKSKATHIYRSPAEPSQIEMLSHAIRRTSAASIPPPSTTVSCADGRILFVEAPTRAGNSWRNRAEALMRLVTQTEDRE